MPLATHERQRHRLTRRLNAHLAARASIANALIIDAADAHADAADAAVIRCWREVQRVIKQAAQPSTSIKARHVDINRLRHVMRQAAEQPFLALVDGLAALAATGHRHAVDALMKLPKSHLLAVAAMAGRRERLAGVMEEVGVGDDDEPAVPTDPEARKRYIASVLFPAPSRDASLQSLSRFVRPQQFAAIGDESPRMPDDLANQVAMSISQGKTAKETEAEIRPFFDGSRVRARRFARTVGAHVATDQSLATHLQLGPLLAGFQIHATLDQNTRPLHASRDGTVYYVAPVGNQLEIDKMPRPPLEADGSIAWNCRCYLSAVLRGEKRLEASPLFAGASPRHIETARAKSIPDPAIYADWFNATATLKQRRLAVGSRRYTAALSRLDGEREPRFEDFIHAKTGELLPPRRLERESDDARHRRLGAMVTMFARARRWLEVISRFGFEKGSL